MYKIISSGSKGNAVLYFGTILIDCGVPYTSIQPYLYDIQIVLLTHRHLDHFNFSAIERLCYERPTLRIGCGPHMVDYLNGIKNVDVYNLGKWYDYGDIKIAPVKLYHDVPNYGYRLMYNLSKVFHATDTAHLDGIEAKNYDLYAIESNYNEDTVYDIISDRESRGLFAHQKGAINSHLSEQQARDFILKNKGEHSQIIRLHESSTSL